MKSAEPPAQKTPNPTPANTADAETHRVFNQPPPLQDYSLLASDPALTRLIGRHPLGWAHEAIAGLAETLGRAAWIDQGFQANDNPPVFQSHNARGERINQVNYHPAYHALMDLAVAQRIHALPWIRQEASAHVARMTMNYLYNQNEAGSACPLTMTFACVPSLQQNSDLAAQWLPGIFSDQYDPANAPWTEKKGLTIGMAMTEKQGGTDVRANTTHATAVDGNETLHRLHGHKWFCSAPMSDAFLVLAQAEAGLSCFLMPRWRSDGSLNPMHIQRLKNKMGNRANASSEIELRGAEAWLLGEPGHGVRTIIRMVALTRYDCMIGSSALMRQSVAQVCHHIRHREVMGRRLLEQPLMHNVVADLCLESEAALLLTERMAAALDADDDPMQQAMLRVGTALGKFWICKRATALIAEAQECLGGGGYIEESILARLYREAPVNSIWEGSGNVQCLDVLRALQSEPLCWQALCHEWRGALGAHPLYDAHVKPLLNKPPAATAHQARAITQHLALALQGALMVKYCDNLTLDAWCRSRLHSGTAGTWGSLPADIDSASIVQSAFNPIA